MKVVFASDTGWIGKRLSASGKGDLDKCPDSKEQVKRKYYGLMGWCTWWEVYTQKNISVTPASEIYFVQQSKILII